MNFNARADRLTLLTALAACLASLPAAANEKLAAEKNCLSCHAVASKLVGPAYTAVAAKYAGQKGAADSLALKIRSGGAGAWGVLPMPANPQVSPAEAKKLAEWVLSLK